MNGDVSPIIKNGDFPASHVSGSGSADLSNNDFGGSAGSTPQPAVANKGL